METLQIALFLSLEVFVLKKAGRSLEFRCVVKVWLYSFVACERKLYGPPKKMTRTVVSSSLWEGRAVVTTALALLFLLPMATTAQQLCLCQPSTYELTLNFNGTCMDQTVMMPNDTMAVAEVACVVQNGVPPLVDPIPVSVSNILISELDQQQQIVRQENNTRTFANGDVVAYESILSLTNPGMFDNVTTPSGLLIMITGVNEGGVVIENTFVILFSNLCNVYPVLEAGDQIGWIIFVSRIRVVIAVPCQTCTDSFLALTHKPHVYIDGSHTATRGRHLSTGTAPK